MMGRVGRALVMHELLERTRDRWVLVISALFALLATGVSLYGRSAEVEVAKLTGPSLVTLTALLVPLVAMVLSHDAIVGERERNTLGLLLSLPVSRIEVALAKFLGRALALVASVTVGLGVAMLASDAAGARTLAQLLGPTLLLGLAFLSLGMLISTCSRRQVTAASIVVVTWFLLVFFYDLGLLGLLVITDGAISQETISRLVIANPSGLFRLQMMQAFAGPEVLRDLGMTATLPGNAATALLWGAWLVIPNVASGILLTRQKVV
jgi:Cu-processing system permease protein